MGDSSSNSASNSGSFSTVSDGSSNPSRRRSMTSHEAASAVLQNDPRHHVIYTGRDGTADMNARLQSIIGVTLIAESGSQSGDSSSHSAATAAASGGMPAANVAGGTSNRKRAGTSWADQMPVAQATADPPAPIDETLKQILRECGNREYANLVTALINSGQPECEVMKRYWSAGAEGHAAGECNKCNFAHNDDGCNKGPQCEFCHMPHPSTNPRPSKPHRVYFHKFQAELFELYDRAPQTLMNGLLVAVEGNPALQPLVLSWVNRVGGGTGASSSRGPGVPRTRPRNIMSL